MKNQYISKQTLVSKHHKTKKVMDLFLNDWYNKVDSNMNYRMYKHKFEFERYLIILPSNLLHYFSSFRTRNHRLEVETELDWHKKI